MTYHLLSLFINFGTITIINVILSLSLSLFVIIIIIIFFGNLMQGGSRGSGGCHRCGEGAGGGPRRDPAPGRHHGRASEALHAAERGFQEEGRCPEGSAGGRGEGGRRRQKGSRCGSCRGGSCTAGTTLFLLSLRWRPLCVGPFYLVYAVFHLVTYS